MSQPRRSRRATALAPQPSLWGSDAPSEPPGRDGMLCYLCLIDGRREPAEAKCSDCGQPICYPCGAIMEQHFNLPPWCLHGPSCRSGRREEWHRQQNIIHGLCEGHEDYPHENLRNFIEHHMQRMQWMHADTDYYRQHTDAQIAQDKRDMLRAVRKAQRLLEPPAPRTTQKRAARAALAGAR